MAAPFYDEIRFPERVSAGAEAVVRSKTSVVPTAGGGERRNKRWSSQLRLWDVARGITRTSDLELVRNVHVVVDGRHAGFRYRDFSDYAAAGQVVDTSAGGAGPFQLRKGYTAGSVTKWRKIQKPVKRTTQLTLNGEPCVVLEDGETIEGWTQNWGQWEWGTNPEDPATPRFELDTTTGLLTPVVPEELVDGDVLSASFEFDCPARFGSDELRVKAVARGSVWEWPTILVMEIRL